MKKSTIGFWITVGILLVVILVVFLRMVLKQNSQEQEIAQVEVPVVVIEAKNQAIEDILQLTGYIDPIETVNVVTKIPGKFLNKVVDKGAYVVKDQVIANVIRDEPGVQFEPYPVKSPINGVVAKFMFDPGAQVAPQYPLAVVVNIDTVLIKTSVVEKDYARVKYGQLAKIYTDAYPERWFEGRISKIAPVLDRASHTADIEIRIPNPEHLLKPGMFVRVSLVVDKKENVPVIPKTAIIKRMGKDLSFVLNSGNLIEERELKLGFYDLEHYEVLEGIKAGELVVAENLAILKAGVKAVIAKKLGEAESEPESGSGTETQGSEVK